MQCPVNERSEHAFDAVGGADLARQLAVEAFCLAPVDGGEELAAVGEVLVHERATDAGALRDRLHRHGGDISCRHELDGGVEQGVASFAPREPRRVLDVGRPGLPCGRLGHGDILSP
jgi:hypothetical protein